MNCALGQLFFVDFREAVKSFPFAFMKGVRYENGNTDYC